MHLSPTSKLGYLSFKTAGLHCQTPILTHVCQAGRQLYYFCDGLWYVLAVLQTHDLPCERLTR